MLPDMVGNQGLGGSHDCWDVVAVWEPIPGLAMVLGAHKCSQEDVEVRTSPRPCSQAPYAMVFVEQHISLVRIWLHLCECRAEVLWWKTSTGDHCFLASAKWFLWVLPHLHSVLGLSKFPAWSPACPTL